MSMNYNYQFNPYLQRLNQMEQQFPQYAQTPITQTPNLQQGASFATIPVTNREEANAFRVDMAGAPTFFYNANKNEVYMKRTNMQTGMADFFVFSKSDEQLPVKTSEFDKEFKKLNDKVDKLYSLLKQPNEGKNVK